MVEIAASSKIAYHKEKLDSYLQGKHIFPATLELDITTECNRKCPNCPSTTTMQKINLDLKVIERLMSLLEGKTRGLILTGGEPTISPILPDVLSMAKDYGFIDVAVVTNGNFLDKDSVADALISYASAVRISLYDWTVDSSEGLEPTLKRINVLRKRIEKEQSPLRIGVSALTSTENIKVLRNLCEKVKSSGAHWIYFHPRCINWDAGTPNRMDQSGIIEEIEALSQENGFHAFAFPERYKNDPVTFDEYHAAHFLLVIGADGKNYLGAEVKYQPTYIIGDIINDYSEDFLWRKERLERIQTWNSSIYPAIGSRHRGILYNNLIEKMMNGIDSNNLHEEFLFPHIL